MIIEKFSRENYDKSLAIHQVFHRQTFTLYSTAILTRQWYTAEEIFASNALF